MEERIESQELVAIEEKDVPAVIQERFDALSSLKNDIEEIRVKAGENQGAAQNVKNARVHLFGGKKQLDNVQEVVANIADNQVAAAEINGKILDYQQKSTETLKFILSIGVTNLANNRAVVKYLKEKLESSSNKEFSEIEEAELLDVIKQLKAQEDLMTKQEQLSQKVKKHDEFIEGKNDKDIQQDQIIKEYQELVDRLSAEVTGLSKKVKLLLIAGCACAFLVVVGIVLSLVAILL